MRGTTLLIPLSLLAASAAAVAAVNAATDGEQELYLQNNGGGDQKQPMEPDDYSNLVASLLRRQADKRSCVRRGTSCDARPYDCCSNGTCRCNLWGSNCKCARGGLFKAWGRRK